MASNISRVAFSTFVPVSDSIVVAPRIPRMLMSAPKNKKSEPFGSLFRYTGIFILPIA
jgi:hypothetical protein